MNRLHPIMTAALAGFMPMIMQDDDEDTEVLDDQEPHEVMCNTCSGSGEGQHDGTTCRVCKGAGELWVTE